MAGECYDSACRCNVNRKTSQPLIGSKPRSHTCGDDAIACCSLDLSRHLFGALRHLACTLLEVFYRRFGRVVLSAGREREDTRDKCNKQADPIGAHGRRLVYELP